MNVEQDCYDSFGPDPQVEAPELIKCQACKRLVGKDELTHEACLACEEEIEYEQKAMPFMRMYDTEQGL
jgi:methionyl-tRNA synthetase